MDQPREEGSSFRDLPPNSAPGLRSVAVHLRGPVVPPLRVSPLAPRLSARAPKGSLYFQLPPHAKVGLVKVVAVLHTPTPIAWVGIVGVGPEVFVPPSVSPAPVTIEVFVSPVLPRAPIT